MLDLVKSFAFTTGGLVPSQHKEYVLVYIGPDALMPLASMVAAIGGFLLMFWKRVVGAAKYVVSKFSSKK